MLHNTRVSKRNRAASSNTQWKYPPPPVTDTGMAVHLTSFVFKTLFCLRFHYKMPVLN